MVEKIISIGSSIHEAYPEYLSKDLRQRILSSEESPFSSEQFVTVDSDAFIEKNDSVVILAPSSMLISGPSAKYLEKLAPDPKNKLILLSYQAPDTPGRNIQDGSRQLLIEGNELRLECQVQKIEGFSSHSDYNQLIAYISRLRPKLRRVLVNHGERAKAQNLASSINKMFKIQTQHPLVQEAIKLL